MLTDEPHTESFLVASSEYQNWDQAQEVGRDTYFDYIHPAFRAFAQKTKNEVELGLRQKWQQTLDIGRKLLKAKQVLTPRKEYSRFRDSLSLTAADARKFVKLVEVFGDWDIERLLVISGVTSLSTLCQAKYALIVSRLREVPEITKELVKHLIEEVRTVQALPVPKAQVQDYGDAVLEKHVDRETGNFYYTLKQVNLSDQVGSALAAKLETHTIGQVLSTLVEVTDEYVTNQLQELQSVVANVQHLSAENQELKFQLQERDWRIAQLESQVLSSVPLQKNNDFQTQSMQFSTWEEVATAIDCERSKLLNTVKKWSTEERQKLSKLLSEFLETSKEGLEQAGWVPENLLQSALQYLFFTVQKITGSNNLIDEPSVEHIQGCRLVSLRDFGTRREHWVFRMPNGKQFPVYGRSEFFIERF